MSQRRTLATLRVAKSIAELSGKTLVTMEEVNEAVRWTIDSFDQIQRWE
jgi:Mg-chelatase subunit ChlI